MIKLANNEVGKIFGGSGECVCTPLSTIWPLSTTYREEKLSAVDCRIWCCNEKKNHHWAFMVSNSVMDEGDCRDKWKKEIDKPFGGCFTQ